MKPYIQNGYLVCEILFDKVGAESVNYKELGLTEPSIFDPDTCEWKKCALKVNTIVAVWELVNPYDDAAHCKVTTQTDSFSLNCSMFDVLEVL